MYTRQERLGNAETNLAGKIKNKVFAQKPMSIDCVYGYDTNTSVIGFFFCFKLI